MFYAQIDENKICIGISELSGDIEENNLIRINDFDINILGKKYRNGSWVKVEQHIVEKRISDRELLEEIYLNQELNKITGGL